MRPRVEMGTGLKNCFKPMRAQHRLAKRLLVLVFFALSKQS